MGKKLFLLVIFVVVLFVPVIMLVQLIESSFWQPNQDQLTVMKQDTNACFHNADCRTQPIEFVGCHRSTTNKYSGYADVELEMNCQPSEPVYVRVCSHNECTKKILGIFE